MDHNMEIVNYKDFWNRQASSAQAAIAAVRILFKPQLMLLPQAILLS